MTPDRPTARALRLTLCFFRSYVDFLARKKIPAEAMALPELNALPYTFDIVRERATGERELYEKSHEAFVSYVRGYREHVCSFIFELKRLDLGLLAKCFCLLRFPAMPELKGPRPAAFVPHPAKHAQIPYKDALREQQRQEKLKVRHACCSPPRIHNARQSLTSRVCVCTASAGSKRRGEESA